MTILANIKREQLQARKDRYKTKADLLTALIGEASMVGKNDGNRESTDAEVIAVIKKFIANAEQTLSFLNSGEGPENIIEIEDEIAILMHFLPLQLTELVLTDAIDRIIGETGATSLRDMGKIMRALKEQYQ